LSVGYRGISIRVAGIGIGVRRVAVRGIPVIAAVACVTSAEPDSNAETWPTASAIPTTVTATTVVAAAAITAAAIAAAITAAASAAVPAPAAAMPAAGKQIGSIETNRQSDK